MGKPNMQMQLAATRQPEAQAIQLSPNRLHASSNYHYHPRLLQPYGISEEDWYSFTYQFVAANSVSRNKIVAFQATNIAVRLGFLATQVVLFVSHPLFPLAAIPASIAITISFWAGYFAMKHQALKRHVRNGDIPRWLEVWNRQYFNPKGLMIGFNLPGHEVQYAPLVPRPRRFSTFRGTYKQPQNQRSANKRARLVIVRLNDQPVPDAGQAPQLTPIKVSRLTKLFVFPKRIGSKIASRKMRAHAKSERLHQERFDLAMQQASRGQLVEAVTPPAVPTWENINASPVYTRSKLVRLSKKVFHRREATQSSTVLLAPSPSVLPDIALAFRAPILIPVAVPVSAPVVPTAVFPTVSAPTPVPVSPIAVLPTVQPPATVSPTVLTVVPPTILPIASPTILPAVSSSTVQPAMTDSPTLLPVAPSTVSPTILSAASSTIDLPAQHTVSPTVPSSASVSPEISPSATPEVLPKISPVGLDGSPTDTRPQSSRPTGAVHEQTKGKAPMVPYICSKCTVRAAKKQAKDKTAVTADTCPKCISRTVKKQAKYGKQMLGGSRMHDAARIVL